MPLVPDLWDGACDEKECSAEPSKHNFSPCGDCIDDVGKPGEPDQVSGVCGKIARVIDPIIFAPVKALII
jgi:hypothetical protein